MRTVSDEIWVTLVSHVLRMRENETAAHSEF